MVVPASPVHLALDRFNFVSIVAVDTIGILRG